MWRGSIKYIVELPRTDNWYDMYIYIYKSAIVRNDLWSPLPGSSSLFQFSTNIWSQDSWQWKCALQSCSLFVFCSCDSIAFIQLDRLSILSNYLTQSFLFIEETPSFFSKQCKSLPTQNILFWNGVIHSVCYIIPHDMALPLHSLCLCSLHSIIISPGSLHVGSHSYDSILHGYLKSCKFKLDSNQRTVFSFKTTIWKVANPDWGCNKKNTLPLSHLPLNSATSRSSSFLTIPCKAHNILRLLAIVCCKCKPNPS